MLVVHFSKLVHVTFKAFSVMDISHAVTENEDWMWRTPGTTHAIHTNIKTEQNDDPPL